MTNPTAIQRTRPLLREAQVAELLNMKVATLRRWRWSGDGPPFIKIRGAVRYDPADIDEFVRASRVTSTSELSAAALG